LSWLLLDHELMAYAKRVARGIEINADTLATEVIERVGPAGHFLAEEHTAQHYRQELWLPGAAWTRQAWDTWEKEGGGSMADRLVAEMQRLLATHQPPRADDALAHELDAIVAAARRELT
jgi:trimethylamine--corrinoid protein Co-methyltransferase